MAGNVVPKELLLYWHQGWDRAPDLVKRCAATWLARNPSWNVNVMDRDSVEKKVSIPRAVKALNLPLPAFANFIRMCFLKRGGGVWADATCWCARPLDDWIELICRPAGFFAYEKPVPSRPIGNWFLAAAPDNRIVSIWYAAMLRLVAKVRWCSRLRLLRLPCEKPMSWAFPQLKDLSFPESDNLEDENYFWHHRLFQLCLDSNDEFRELWSSVPKVAAAGPHTMQRHGLLNSVNQDISAHIRDKRSAVYKLTRRKKIPADISGTILDALYRSGEGRY